MLITNTHEAKATLSALIQKALAGEEVVIARAGEPLVRLTPIERSFATRKAGLFTNDIHFADGWDEEDEEITELMNHQPLFPKD